MQVLAISTVFTALSLIAVGLRLYTRFRVTRSPGWDDCAIVMAMIMSMVFYASLMVEIHYGLGQPKATLPPDHLRKQLRALWLTIAIYNFSLVLTKLSICLLYLRLFPQRWFVISTHAVMGVLILFGLWAVVGAFFFCNPVHAFWDQTIRHPSCLPQKEVWFFNASMNIVTDLVIFLLPMPLLSVTHMPFKQKLAVMSMFSIGFFVCVTSAVRVVVMRNLINTPDISKNNAPVAAWSNIEANVAILCSCLPALYPLLTRFGSRHFPGSSRPRGKRSVHRGLGAYDPNWSIYQGQSGYAASVVGQENVEHPELEGIKVVQELRMESDLAGAVDLPKIAPAHHDPI